MRLGAAMDGTGRQLKMLGTAMEQPQVAGFITGLSLVYHWFITGLSMVYHGLSWFIIIFSHQDIPTSWRHPSANKVNSCATNMWLTLRYDHTCRREATEGLRIDQNAR